MTRGGGAGVQTEGPASGRVIRSIYSDQSDILRGIMTLSGIERFDVDLTYGNGSFYRDGIPKPEHRFDLDGDLPDVTKADSRNVPLADGSVESVVFDPPFLTYVRQGRAGNGSMVMARRFAGYWRYDELEEHYRSTLAEAHRILRPKGILVVKCQDIIHNHRLHPTHIYLSQWAEGMFRLKDLHVLKAHHRMPSPNRRGKQRHARIFHSYFMVFERNRGKPSG